MLSRIRRTKVRAFGALILTAGVLLIFTACDGPVGTNIQRQIASVTEWTPENIVKHPEDYIFYCEGQLARFVEERNIAIATLRMQKGELQKQRERNLEKVGAGEKGIRELKALFVPARESNTWPIEWRGKSLTMSDASLNLQLLDSEVELSRRLSDRQAEIVSKLDSQITHIERQKTEGAELEMKIEGLKADLAVKRLDQQMEASILSIDKLAFGIDGLLATTESGAADLVTADDIAREDKGAVDMGRIDEILGKY